MSTVHIDIQAENCNAWASDLVMGLPSPLSISLYLRALFIKARETGYGEVYRFSVGIRKVDYDDARLSSRPLLVYQREPRSSELGPLFEEQRMSLALNLVVETTGMGKGVDTLSEAVMYLPFLGGNVRGAFAQEISKGEEHEVLKGSRIMVDATDSIRELFDGDMLQAMEASLLVTITDPYTRNMAAERLNIDQSRLDALSVRNRYYMLPLGHRVLTPFIERDDARPVVNKDGELEKSVHAFSEGAHGFVQLLGSRRAFSEARPWWRHHTANSLTEPMIYYVKGESHV